MLPNHWTVVPAVKLATRLLQPLDPETVCGVCNDIIRDVQTCCKQCRSGFCSPCFLAYTSEFNQCPTNCQKFLKGPFPRTLL